MSEPAWKPTSDHLPSVHRHRQRRRRAQVRRRRAVALLVVLAVIIVSVWALTSGGGTPASTAAGNQVPGGPSTTRAQAGATTTTVPPTTTTTTGPGSLPQTGTFPTTTSPVFVANMAALWNAVVTDSLPTGMPAFFPEPAYVQLKTVASASGDFTNRLESDYGLDIASAHALLGPDAATAHFVGVNADSSYGHWINSGVCDNDVGYFELPNTRVIYTVNGQTHSFGIASMISWRGEWYVVHLGAILRSGSGGEVDDPETGPGSPTYSSTC
ncbi:MAG TPA: hypothetical protein VG205_01085 [Acidimicrobiales bacterium]|jgi:hypothetical protein|nr:hypothetical protein [Acidimicrobiales bacterium]